MSVLLALAASITLALTLAAPRATDARSWSDPDERRGVPSRLANRDVVQQEAATAVGLFLQSWRRAWLASERDRLRVELDRRNPKYERAQRVFRYRAMIGFCPRDGYTPQGNPNPIVSPVSRAGKCPSGPLSDGPLVVDEAEQRDAGISPERRTGIQAERSRLIQTLASLQERAPNDVFIVGQRVRFLIDAGRIEDAIAVASACSADPLWCTLLRGYALATGRQTAAADSVFDVATQMVPPPSRCEWTDIGLLLRWAPRNEYRAKSCAERDSLARQYWWTGRPLLRDIPGPNRRRVEHYRRKVLVMLHSSLPFNEVYDLRMTHGGDVVNEMLVRYGWPTVTAWSGDSVDNDIDRLLRERQMPLGRPYTSHEYASGRVAFAATWAAILDPFQADTAAWGMRPRPGVTDENYRFMAGPPGMWWVPEHMKFDDAPIMQLPAGQTAFFRRPRSLRMLAALETEKVLQGERGETARVALVGSPTPDSATLIAESSVSSTGRVELSGEVEARPMLVGIESKGTPAKPLLARTRFGVVPPLPLDSLPANDIAISTPVFFAARDAASLPRDLESLSRAMLGTTAVPRGGKIGVFWETYGTTASDSIRYAVRISRMETVGVLQRLGALLRVVDLPTGNVSLAWQEASRGASGGAGNAAQAAVSIAAGSVELDLASLSRGTYMIEVTAAVAGRPEARAGRVLTIR